MFVFKMSVDIPYSTRTFKDDGFVLTSYVLMASLVIVKPCVPIVVQ